MFNNPLVKKYFQQKNLPQDIGLTFEDVVIIDQYSKIASRKDINNIQARIAEGIVLSAPFVSANMDTITESQMAIALARLGGMGVIHQFLPISRRVAEVKKVKRADNFIISHPLTITEDKTLKHAKALMEQYQVYGLLVTRKEKLVGILSHRDYYLETDDHKKVKELMTSKNLVTAPHTISFAKAKQIFNRTKKEKLPLVDSHGQLKGLICAKDVLKRSQYPDAFRDQYGRLGVAAAVGIGKEMIKEIGELLQVEVDGIVIDTARGNCQRLENKIKEARKKYGKKLVLMAGNIDTPEACERLIKAGANCVKVGIGGGAACKTRVGTGVGIPQITAVAACTAVAKKYNVGVIADSGVKSGADFCKALAAGANAVMSGSLCAGTKETPGEIFYEDGREWKLFRGSASLEFQVSRVDRQNPEENVRTPEGVTKRIPYKGSITTVVKELMGYLRSSMSYVGVTNLDEFHQQAVFMRQTIAGLNEGKPHDTN
ncbi:IMP dehydrogenase [Patescibacteria group bacterium]|nr:IMP dehydrogenase [Patescibacteria group bacterium]